jgi:hypothetical protein
MTERADSLLGFHSDQKFIFHNKYPQISTLEAILMTVAAGGP